MNNRSYYNLDLDTSNAITEGFAEERIGSLVIEKFRLFEIKKVLKKEWIEYFTAAVGAINHVMVFSRPAFSSTSIAHIDLKGTGDPAWFGINWILSGRDSQMVWFDLPKNYSKADIKFTQAGTPFSAFNVASLTEVDRCQITDKPVLVRTDIPHSIIVDQEPRISISVRPFSSLDAKCNWDKSVDFFRGKQLIIE